MTKKHVLLCGSAAAVVFLSASALAQPAPAAASTELTDASEIIVTAQRRSERLEDVPMAITALSGESLENAGVVNIQDLGRVAAGVQVGFAGAFTAPSVRGVSTITNGNVFENNVAVYVDGFYEPNTLVINQDLPNLADIQVLKGPQGTLYGRNATGGAILINTLAPTDTPTARAEVTYGRFEDKRISGYVAGPISESIRYSIAGYHRHTPGYIKLIDPNVIGRTAGDAAPIRQASLRTKLEFDLGEPLTATLAYNYAFANDPRGSLFSVFEHVSPLLPPPPLRPTRLGTAAYNYETTVPASSHQGTLKVALDTGIGSLTSYTGYTFRDTKTIFDFDGSYADLVYSTNNWKQDTWQQAVDFVIDAVDNFNLIVGGMYFWDDNRLAPEGLRSFGANRRLLTLNRIDQKTEAWAVYADATYAVTDALSINVGGRYSHESKENGFTSISFAANPAGSITVGPLEREASFSKFTPRAVIRYAIAPRTNIYASYSKGFRSGTFNSTPPAVPTLWAAVDPETINAYEIGFKTAGRGLRFDAAAFYYDYKDLQVNVTSRSPLCPPAPAPCGLLLSLLSNAPKSEIYGFDAQASATPVDNLNIRAGVSVLHARYKVFPNAVGTGLNAATDTNVSGQLQNWSGQQLARAPDFSGNVGVDYEIPLREGGLLLSANANYTDSYVISNPSLFGPLAGPALANKQRFRQGHYALVNASATWTDPSGHFWVGVYGRNLTDKQYRITYNGGQFGDYSAVGEPLTYGVRAGFQF